eukprot:366130-Chlamydomonas_euryale.AAC.38
MVRLCLHCGGGGGRTAQAPPVALGRAVDDQQAGGRSGQQGSAAAVSAACAGAGGIVCDSLDCGIYFERRKLANELSALSALQASATQLLGDT